MDNWQAQRQVAANRSGNYVASRHNPATGTVTPTGQLQRLTDQPHAVPYSASFTTQATESTLSNANAQSAEMQNANSLTFDYLAGAGNFLGIAQQYSDNPLPNEEIMHLFNGEDINYWFGNDPAMTENPLYHEQSFH
jgi:hypothetical protein